MHICKAGNITWCIQIYDRRQKFTKQKQYFSSPYDMHVEIVGVQPKFLFFIICYRSITMISDSLILEGIYISEVPYKQLENLLHGSARQFQIIKIYYNDFR